MSARPQRPAALTAPPPSALLGNAASLIATSAVTSGLGFAFWWAAARLLPPEVVGQGGALISVMTLAGTLAVLGVGTLLINELPTLERTRRGELSAGLLSAGLLGTAAAAALTALLVAPAVPLLLPGLARSVSGPWLLPLFVLGAALTTAGLVFDQAVIGLLRGDLQLRRNFIAALARLAVLALITRLTLTPQALSGAWTAAAAASLLSVIITREDRRTLLARPAWDPLRRLAPAALRHHLLNLAMQTPGLILPVLVATQLSARENAQFYLAWLMAGFLGMIPYSLAAVLPAVAGSEPEERQVKVQQSLRWSLTGCAAGAAILILLARPLLSAFGPSYVATVPALQLLTLTAFPVIVKAHYVALGRLENRLIRVAGVIAALGLGELTAVWTGGRVGGLTGMAAGLLAAYVLGAAWTLPAVLRSARGTRTAPGSPPGTP